MKTVHLIFAFVLLSCVVLGDGIPVDRKTGQITVPHTFLKLTGEQIDELAILGTLTLTDPQWKQFRAIGSNCPKRFQIVLPITWEYCTCDMHPYAIQMSEDSVAIIHEEISGDAGTELATAIRETTDGIRLKVDRRGQYYYNGVLIPFDSLLKMLTGAEIAKTKDGKEKRYFSVEIPLGLSGKSPQLQSRLMRLYSEAKNAGFMIPADPN
jgi:hypothetical protein